MKKLLLLAFLALTVMVQAQTITVGEGSDMTAQVPFNTFYNYSFTEQIFHASEIEYAGNIKAIKFRLAYSYNSDHLTDIAVYLKNVSRSTFANSNDYEPVSADDKVFSGPWVIPADVDDWITIEFDAPFYYNGTDNLLIAIDENSDDYAIRYFRCTEVENSVLNYGNDSQNPDPYDLDSYVGFKETQKQRANIKLVFGAFTGVDENQDLMRVYPNPSAGVVTVEGTGRLVVVNTLGQQVLSCVVDGQATINLPVGLYFVHMENEKGSSVSKLLVF